MNAGGLRDLRSLHIYESGAHVFRNSVKLAMVAHVPALGGVSGRVDDPGSVRQVALLLYACWTSCRVVKWGEARGESIKASLGQTG